MGTSGAQKEKKSERTGVQDQEKEMREEEPQKSAEGAGSERIHGVEAPQRRYQDVGPIRWGDTTAGYRTGPGSTGMPEEEARVQQALLAHLASTPSSVRKEVTVGQYITVQEEDYSTRQVSRTFIFKWAN
ncbi:hypothetical protein NDU88_005154 [Pleurodeles waltl]|uniref:Uncharacterized protein n=1 Tax=Pleurodeles waltl TaxID=8319 RepID=A0AAV7SL10_PLEWA|nr:hypothetical protein NDU88_005154 [Pleurodeles waltl]